MPRKLLLMVALVVVGPLVGPRSARAGDDGSGREPDVEATDQPRARPRLRAFALGGPSYGDVFGIGLRSFRIEGGAVLDASRRLGVTFAAGHDTGETTYGLSAGDVHLYATFDLIAGRVRVGIGPELSYFWMTRPHSSSAGRNIDAFGTGLRLRVGLDAVDFGEGRAIFVGASAEAGWLRGGADFFDIDGGTATWRAAATAGVRF